MSLKKKLRLEPGEQVVVATLAHPSKLIKPAVVLVLAVFLHGLLQRILEVRWRPIDQPWTSIHTVLGVSLSVLLVLVILLAVLRPLLRWARTRFVLTDRRLILVGGAAPRDGVRLPLAWLHGVDAAPGRGPLGSTGIGTLSADFGQAGTLRLTHAPRVEAFGQLIQTKAEALRFPRYQDPYAHGAAPGYGSPYAHGPGRAAGDRW